MCAATTLSNSQVGQALIDQAKEQNKAKDNVKTDREDISSLALPSAIPPSADREAKTGEGVLVNIVNTRAETREESGVEGMVEDIVHTRPESSAQSIVEGIVSSQQGREQDWKKQEERIIEAVTRLLDSKSIEIDGSSLRVNPLSTNYRTFERAKELGFEVRKVEGAEDLYQVYHNGEKTDWAISTASQNGVPQSEKEIIAKIATQLDKFLPNEIPIDVRGFAAGKEKFTPQSPAKIFSKALSPETPIESITQLPSSVASVQVHHPEGATAAEKQKPGRVLIHVRQMHGASALEDPSALPADLRADLERYLPKAQAQLSQILTAFSQRNVAPGIYTEGMDPRTAASYRQNLAVLSDPGTRQSVANLEQAFQTKTAKDTAVKLRQIQLRFPEPRDAQVNKLVNAMEFLHDYQQLRETVQKDPILSSIARGQFQLYPGENERIHQENIDYVNQHPNASVDDPKMAALMDKRDSHLVETVGNSQAEVSLAVLGAGHDLKAEVDAWNKKHPDDPITLVEVEPTAVTAYLNKENGNSRGVKGIAAR